MDVQHLGIALNGITSLTPLSLPPTHWAELISLNISWNELSDLNATLEVLSGLDHLASLSAVGNPFCLLATYRAATIKRLRSLVILDDRDVAESERMGAEGACASATAAAYFQVTVSTLDNLPRPKESTEDDVVHTRCSYLVGFSLPGTACNAEPLSGAMSTLIKEAATTPAVSAAGLGVDTAATQALPWSVPLQYGATFTLECHCPAEAKRALVRGLHFSVFCVTQLGTLAQPRESHEATTSALCGKKAKLASADQRRRHLAPKKASRVRVEAPHAQTPAERSWSQPTLSLLGTFTVPSSEALLDGQAYMSFCEEVVGADGAALTGMPAGFYHLERTAQAAETGSGKRRAAKGRSPSKSAGKAKGKNVEPKPTLSTPESSSSPNTVSISAWYCGVVLWAHRSCEIRSRAKSNQYWCWAHPLDRRSQSR